MAVVINDFEVSVEASESSADSGSPEEAVPEPPRPNPLEVMEVIRRAEARRARVDAP